MLPETTYRVEKNTKKDINERIQAKTEAYIRAFGSNPESIRNRLKELDEEWDIERLLETNGSILLLTGLALGALVNRRWFLLPMFVGGFCLQHALQGWCPPVEAFRRMGVRTSREIEEERIVLKHLRGDFNNTPQDIRSEYSLKKLVSAARQ